MWRAVERRTLRRSVTWPLIQLVDFLPGNPAGWRAVVPAALSQAFGRDMGKEV